MSLSNGCLQLLSFLLLLLLLLLRMMMTVWLTLLCCFERLRLFEKDEGLVCPYVGKETRKG